MLLSLVLLARTAEGQWRPGIGDPTLLGWLTVVAYFGAAWYCHRAARRAASLGAGRARLRMAWLALAVLMVFLGINKQLDLQSLLTLIGKQMALDQGWYAERHVVQIWFIRALVAGAVAALATAAWLMRRHVRAFWLAGFGAIFITAFVLIRGASFHRVDVFLSGGPLGVRLNWMFELGGIACIAFAARRYATRRRRSKVQS